MSDKIDNIELDNLDWRKLDLDTFSSLSKYADSLSKRVTKSKPAPKGSKVKTKLIKLSGVTYQITEDVYIRLKSLKSDKSKQKLVKEIQETGIVVPTLEL